MSKVPSIVPVTDLRQDAAAIIERVRSSRGPLVVTQRGRAAAIMISVEEYERSEQERELLLALALGEREIAAGRGATLSQVLKKADDLLKPKK